MVSIFTFEPAASRKTDPDSSHIAERQITVSGVRGSQQREILELVKQYPGKTSLELTRYSKLDRYQIARRLSDLNATGFVFQGPIRRCAVGDRKSVTWFPIGFKKGQQKTLF